MKIVRRHPFDEVAGMQAAREGDYETLSFIVRQLKSADVSCAFFHTLADVIDGKLPRARGRPTGPRGRPSRRMATAQHVPIVMHVLASERLDIKRDSAVVAAATEFGCSERTVWNALKEYKEDGGVWIAMGDREFVLIDLADLASLVEYPQDMPDR